MDVKALYVISGDPVTYGHLDVMKRAYSMFGSLLVAIADNPTKKYTFMINEREELTRQAVKTLKGCPDIKVTSFDGLTVDYARLHNIPVIIRSARDTSDYNYEHMLNEVNASQKLGIETIMLFPSKPLSHISSSAVKALQQVHGQIQDYVPLVIKEVLERAISKQIIIGLTGEIGAGKSYVAKEFLKQSPSAVASLLSALSDEYSKKLAPPYNVPVHNIDLDILGREILTVDHSPMFMEVRSQLVDLLGTDIIDKDTSSKSSHVPVIDVKALGSFIFKNSDLMKIFNEVMRESMLLKYRQSLKDKEGLILLNSALIAEADIGYLCNNNVILLSADMAVREDRLKRRGYTEEEIQRRINAQWSFDYKAEALEKNIIRDGHGWVMPFDNTQVSSEQIHDQLYKKVMEKIL